MSSPVVEDRLSVLEHELAEVKVELASVALSRVARGETGSTSSKDPCQSFPSSMRWFAWDASTASPFTPPRSITDDHDLHEMCLDLRREPGLSGVPVVTFSKRA